MENNWLRKSILLSAFALMGLLSLHAQDKAPGATTAVRKTVTVRVLGENKRMPDVTREDVKVTQGKNRLQVTDWSPAKGDRAGLDLFLLIDDASDTNLGSQLDDLRAFINAQPPTTAVGVGYMQNGTVQIKQNFTTDHSQAAKALRLPFASVGVYGSPYLSVIDLMNRWPENSNRREVVMVTDGIDRARRGQNYSRGLNFASPDLTSASQVAQRTGTIIDTIFTRGVGHLGRNFWAITSAQNSIARLADETGGQAYYLGTQSPVSFKPYLDDLQTSLDNQYLLEFHAVPSQEPGLQSVKLDTEVAGVELNSADGVWVEAR